MFSDQIYEYSLCEFLTVRPCTNLGQLYLACVSTTLTKLNVGCIPIFQFHSTEAVHPTAKFWFS